MRMLAGALALLLGLAVSSEAAIIEFTSPLAPEVMGSSGSGFVVVTYDDVAHTLVVDADWDNLTGTTTVAHIHCCTASPGAGVIGVAVTPGTLPGFPAGATSGSYLSPNPIDLLDMASYTAAFLNNFGGGTAGGAEAALVAGILAGEAYFNVHTNFAQGGEIRGFLAAVPEPALISLVGLGLGAAATLRRRR